MEGAARPHRPSCRHRPPPPATGAGPSACDGGFAAGFPCEAIQLHKHLTLAELGGAVSGNDIWGWTDATNVREYALVGLSNGVAFVDVTEPDTPVVHGILPTATVDSPWRDIKVFEDHAYVVADAVGAHGMQVFDLTRLFGSGTDQVFQADVVYGDFGSAHNVAINESAGTAFVVGSDTCDGGLHMIDITHADQSAVHGMPRR